jgi:hypothetical protein
MRESDQHKVIRSYTTEFSTTKGWTVKPECWTTDYSAAHQATPVQAIDYRIDALKREQKMIEQQIMKLHSLKHKEKN